MSSNCRPWENCASVLSPMKDSTGIHDSWLVGPAPAGPILLQAGTDGRQFLKPLMRESVRFTVLQKNLPLTD